MLHPKKVESENTFVESSCALSSAFCAGVTVMDWIGFLKLLSFGGVGKREGQTSKFSGRCNWMAKLKRNVKLLSLENIPGGEKMGNLLLLDLFVSRGRELEIM